MIARPLAKVRSVNENSNAYASIIDTLTEPVGDAGTATGACVIDVGLKGGGAVPRYLEVWPYGLGADEDAFSFRILAWQRIVPKLASDQWQWTCEILAELACVLGSSTGVAGGAVLNTELYADTVTIVSEETITADVTRQGTVLVFSPANNTKAHVRLDIEGVEKIQFDFKQTTNTPTMNALFRFYDLYID